ncbi:MAG: helix-turn-helix domain-containing protein [Actinomycetota bacterium]|nr:helix-turn-helix domain-containing protein [Actinomycetota bacterium]
MDAARSLRAARRRAGYSQRDLARRVGVAQPFIARIESGTVRPRTDTLEKLLRTCGETLEVRPVRGRGIDRSLIREVLALSPGERLRRASEDAIGLSRLLARRG